MTKSVGWMILALGLGMLGYEAWSVAPVLVVAVCAILGGGALIVMVQANNRIRQQRGHYEHLHEELRARRVDDEVEMMDEEGAYI